MIDRVRFVDAAGHVQITMRDGSVWDTDSRLPADNQIRRALRDWLAAGNKPEPFAPKPPPVRPDINGRLAQIEARLTALENRGGGQPPR